MSVFRKSAKPYREPPPPPLPAGLIGVIQIDLDISYQAHKLTQALETYHIEHDSSAAALKQAQDKLQTCLKHIRLLAELHTDGSVSFPTPTPPKP